MTTRAAEAGVEIEIEMKDGLRRVRPYFYDYRCRTKGRWITRSILEVFAKEFRDRTPDYYAYALEKGFITVNGEAVDKGYLFKGHEVVTHTIHRHEPPVSAVDVKIVAHRGRALVVDKPAGIPVHPTGRYRYNTLLHLLEQKGHGKLHTINRLDRLTSGIMLLALDGETADQYARQMRAHEFRKEYLAKVAGEFPAGKTVVDKPILTFSYKLGLNAVHEKGKPCRTIFHRLSYDAASDTSVLHVQPITGRTHQIRVHAQYLGHPISNDPIYNAPDIWQRRDDQKKATLDDAALDQIVLKFLHKTQALEQTSWSAWKEIEENELSNRSVEESAGDPKLTASEFFRPVPSKWQTASSDSCQVCRAPLFRDPDPDELMIYLHAYRYSKIDSEGLSDGWSYETDWPGWAGPQSDEAQLPVLESLQPAESEGEGREPHDEKLCHDGERIES